MDVKLDCADVRQNNGNTADTAYAYIFFINMVLDHLLPSVQSQAFLELALTSFEYPVAEFYTILLEEHLFFTLLSCTDQSGSFTDVQNRAGLGQC
jgi:hypothetical protein